MHIVIDIPEELFEDIKANGLCGYSSDRDTVSEAIANGTPLPKGHGRLIDVTKVGTSSFKIQEILAKAPTIIEADKSESEDEE